VRLHGGYALRLGVGHRLSGVHRRQAAPQPAFIPVTFSARSWSRRCRASSACSHERLPQPYHPVFNVPRFALASRNRFFLCVGRGI
jgi:hypothetical protein